LEAGTLVLGRVEPTEGDRIRVQVWLVDGTSGADLGKRASFERPASDLIGARDSLATQAADLIRQQLGQEVRLRGQQEGTRSTAAWSLVQRAELLLKQGEAAADEGDTLSHQRVFETADSLLAQAEGLDSRWADPIVLRARLAYLRSRRRFFDFGDVIAAGRWIATGLADVDRALALSATHADALELRGNLQYFKYLLRLEQDPAAANALRDRARADLEQATRLNSTQAGAWASLSHLLLTIPRPALPTSCWRPGAPTSPTPSSPTRPRRGAAVLRLLRSRSGGGRGPLVRRRRPALPRGARVHDLPDLPDVDAGPGPGPGQGVAAGPE
jgi:serine/threonine-protein kinase